MKCGPLAVYLHDQKIGMLQPKRDRILFQFDEEVSTKKVGSPFLSTALLVQNDAFDSEATRNWFAGLLPEDARLNEVKRFFGIQEGDWFSVLEQVGWECAGAVSVKKEDHLLEQETGAQKKTITVEELSQRLRALPSHPYDDASALRVSLGGYQEKLCVEIGEPIEAGLGFVRLNEVNLPLNGRPTTHILKPQPLRFPGMIEGEAWAMSAASRVTPTAQVALLEAQNAPTTLVVKRFDRWIDEGGKIFRIHQEDCAQALGIGSERKYATSGTPKKSDPTFRKIADLLSAYSDEPIQQRVMLLQQMFVNIVLGNSDAHAKNYAILHSTEATVSLSPLYDVVPAVDIIPGALSMGMRIDGRLRIDRVNQENLVNEAKSWSLPTSIIKETLEKAVDDMREGIEYANGLFPEAAKIHSEASLTRLSAFVAK